MSLYARKMVAGVVGVALTLSALVGAGTAADDEKGVPEALKTSVDKIAGAIEKNKSADVKKDTEDLKKFGLKLSMRLFKTRKGHGFGVIAANAADKDGIERKIEALAEEPLSADDLGKESAALVTAAYRTAAIAAIAESRPPAKDDGKKKVKDWQKWSAEMKSSALEFAEAAKSKQPAAVQKAAKKVQDSCTKCHDVFRDDE